MAYPRSSSRLVSENRAGKRSPKIATRAGSRNRRLLLEPLEDRCLLATFQVLNLSDTGLGSLRQAVDDANASPGHDDIEFVGGIRNTLFGGEGLFFATLKGPGHVWIQSLPFSRLADNIIAAAPKAGGKGKEEGSILGGIGRLLDGDN